MNTCTIDNSVSSHFFRFVEKCVFGRKHLECFCRCGCVLYWLLYLFPMTIQDIHILFFWCCRAGRDADIAPGAAGERGPRANRKRVFVASPLPCCNKRLPVVLSVSSPLVVFLNRHQRRVCVPFSTCSLVFGNVPTELHRVQQVALRCC